VDDDVRDLGPFAPDSLLDLACARMRLRERAAAFEPQREMCDEPVVRLQEVKLARLLSRDLAHDPHHVVALG
jgi:hypothetical protein